MTDELTIQPQIQPQQKKSNVMPYALGGAALGAVGGYYTPMVKKSYSSYEDLIKESNDTFDKQISKGGDNKPYWEKAKEHAEKIRNAEAEYNKQVANIKESHKTVASALPETEQAAIDLADAQKKYDAEIAKLTAEHKQTIPGKGSTIVPYDGNWSMTDAQKKEYQKLYNDYITEKGKFESSPRYTDLKTKIADRQAEINQMFDDIKANAEATIDPKSTKRNAIKTMDAYLASDKSTAAIEKALTDNNIVKLSNSELIRLGGGETKLLNAAGTSTAYTQYFPVTAKDGSTKYAKVAVKKIGYGKNEYEKLMGQRTKEAVDRAANQFKTFIETQKKIDKLPETLTFDKSLARQAGLQRYTTGKNSGKIIDAATNFEEFAQKLTEYGSDAKAIENAGLQNYVPKDGVTAKYDKTVTAILKKYGVDTPKEAYETINARKAIGNKYKAELDSLNKVLNDLRTKDPVLDGLNAEMNRLKAGAKELQKAESKIKGRFAKFLGKTETRVETVAGKTREDAVALLKDSKVAKALEEATSKAEARAKELGLTAKELTDDELVKILKDKGIGTKEEFLAKLKNEAKTALEGDLGKFKTSNKWANAAIGAAALAIAGLGIASLTKKEEV